MGERLAVAEETEQVEGLTGVMKTAGQLVLAEWGVTEKFN